MLGREFRSLPRSSHQCQFQVRIDPQSRTVFLLHGIEPTATGSAHRRTKTLGTTSPVVTPHQPTDAHAVTNVAFDGWRNSRHESTYLSNTVLSLSERHSERNDVRHCREPSGRLPLTMCARYTLDVSDDHF